MPKTETMREDRQRSPEGEYGGGRQGEAIVMPAGVGGMEQEGLGMQMAALTRTG